MRVLFCLFFCLYTFSLCSMDTFGKADDLFIDLLSALNNRNYIYLTNFLREHDNNPNVASPDFHKTLLGFTLDNDCFDVALWLFTQGADINFLQGTQKRPLLFNYANLLPSLKHVKFLCEHGASLIYNLKGESTHLLCETTCPFPDILLYLVEQTCKYDSKFGRCKNFCIAPWKVICKILQDNNKKIDDYASPESQLLVAAESHDVEAINYIFEQYPSVNVNVQDYYGNTPLQLAVLSRDISTNQQLQVIKLLMKHGARTDLSNRNGFTPLDCAMLLKNPGAVNLLRAHGAENSHDCEELFTEQYRKYYEEMDYETSITQDWELM
ncbi:MAG: ankyrin repeat domain-containing protein [Epsilonproteobacteria bacterium]|nr:ankyrin repeat domain-containing protein [Campylobacterota bacterium]